MQNDKKDNVKPTTTNVASFAARKLRADEETLQKQENTVRRYLTKEVQRKAPNSKVVINFYEPIAKDNCEVIIKVTNPKMKQDIQYHPLLTELREIFRNSTPSGNTVSSEREHRSPNSDTMKIYIKGDTGKLLALIEKREGNNHKKDAPLLPSTPEQFEKRLKILDRKRIITYLTNIFENKSPNADAKISYSPSAFGDKPGFIIQIDKENIPDQESQLLLLAKLHEVFKKSDQVDNKMIKWTETHPSGKLDIRIIGEEKELLNIIRKNDQQNLPGPQKTKQ